MNRTSFFALALLVTGMATTAFIPYHHQSVTHAQGTPDSNNPGKRLRTETAAIPAKETQTATVWKADRAHSGVKFSVTHLLVSEVDGYFKVFDGTMENTKADFSDAKINFTIDATSVTTNNEARDKHLQTPDFFDTGKYPKITFTSTSFTPLGNNKYTLTGIMVLKDVTKTVKFDVTYNGVNETPRGTKTGFKAKTTLSKKEFGMTGGGAAVGDEVEVVVNLEMSKISS